MVAAKKIQAAELAVFLLLIFPSMLLSATVVKPENLTFSLVAGSTILSDIPLLCLILYFVWRNGETFPAIGLTLKNGWKEALIGVALYIPLVFLMTFVKQGIHAAGLSSLQKVPSFLSPSGWDQIGLALLLLIVVAISEETIFRGYLIRRFTTVSGNPAIALVLSTVVFAAGHGYERSGGVAGVFILGFIFGLIYLWRKSLVAPMVMHFIQDFIGIILIPLLGVLSS